MEKREPERIENQLNFPVDAYLEIDGGNRRGAGPRPRENTEHQKRVRAKDAMDLAFNGQPKSKFLLIIEMDYMPRYEGQRAVKAIPGEHKWPIHHIEYRDDSDKYRVIFHFDCTKKIVSVSSDEDSPMENHKDPTIIHPDEPGGS